MQPRPQPYFVIEIGLRFQLIFCFPQRKKVDVAAYNLSPFFHKTISAQILMLHIVLLKIKLICEMLIGTCEDPKEAATDKLKDVHSTLDAVSFIPEAAAEHIQRKSSIHIFATELKSNGLTMRKALYKHIFASNRFTIRQFIENLAKGGTIANDEKERIKKIFQFEIDDLDAEMGQFYYKKYVQLLQLSNIAFRFTKRQDFVSRFAKQKIAEKSLNALVFFFDLNNDYRELMESNQGLFVEEELAAIFKSSEKQIKFYENLFRQNKQKVLILRGYNNLNVKELIYQLAAVKLKIIISKLNQSAQYQNESCNRGFIQLSLLHVRQYYIKKLQNYNKNESLKQPFFQYCYKQLSFADLSFYTIQKIRKELKQIAKLQHKQQNEKLLIQGVSQRYNMKATLVQKQFRKMKRTMNNQQVEEQSKLEQVFKLFNYYRMKHFYQNAVEISRVIDQKHGLQAKRFLRDNFHEKMREIFLFQENNYVNIVVNLIRLHMATHEVLFIDHCQFYHQQYSLYNLITKNELISYDDKEFSPIEEVIFHLILGVSNNRVVFRHYIKEKLEIYSFFDRLCQVLLFKNSCPSVIVIYIPIRLEARQWQRLDILVKKLSKQGKLTFFLPSKAIVPNIIRAIEHYLKHTALTRMSQQAQSLDFEALLEEFIEKKLSTIQQWTIKQTVRILWKMRE